MVLLALSVALILLQKLEDRIDYIFYLNVTPKSLSHIDDRRQNGLWVSDHLPVLFQAQF